MVSSAVAVVGAGIIAGAALAGCEGPNTCSPLACGDLRVTSADNGKTFNLAVGQTVVESLRDTSKTAVAWSSDPTVVKQTEGPGVISAELNAAFAAVAAGSARLELAYVDGCTASPVDPCFVEIIVNVIEFPRTQVQLFASESGTKTKLHVGQMVSLMLTATVEHYWNLQIEPAGIVDWSVGPALLAKATLQGVLRASSPGEATLTGIADGCPVGSSLCTHQFTLFFSVHA